MTGTLNLTLIIVGLLAFLSAPVTSVISIILTSRIAQRTARKQAADAAKAQAATIQAQRDAALAQEAASRAQVAAAEAATQLVRAARSQAETAVRSDKRLTDIQRVAIGTHAIVNNRMTVILGLVAAQAERIARDNPDDGDAQEAALLARREADSARHAQDLGIGEVKG